MGIGIWIVGLVIALVLGFALWQSRPAGEAPWRFSTALLMTAGALLALTTGLCSLAGATFIFVLARDARNFGRSLDDVIIVLMPIGGFLLTALGVSMFRSGRARVRRDSARHD